MRAAACWASPVFVRMSCFTYFQASIYVFLAGKHVKMRSPACWAFPVFARRSCFYVFSRLDLCVRGWQTCENACARALGAQKYDKIRMPGRLGVQKYDKMRKSGSLAAQKYDKTHGSGRLRAQTYDKIHNSGCLGTQNCAKIHASGRPKGAGFWCLPGVPPTSGQKRPPEHFFSSSKHAFLEACQKWILEPFQCLEGLGRTSTPQYVDLEGLGRKKTK